MAVISILAVEGGLYSNITAMHDAFYIAELWYRKFAGPSETPLFSTRIVTLDGNPVEACGGFKVTPECAIVDAGYSDYMIITPNLPHLTDMPKHIDHLCSHLTGIMDTGTTIATVCTGSFILAETGLLNGKRATTNWQFARMFKKKYPLVRLEPDQALVQDGNIITTGAVTSVYGLILNMIKEIATPSLAALVSKALLIEGGRTEQTPYMLYSPSKSHGDDQVLEAQNYIEKKFAQITSMDDVAKEVGVSPRNLIRRFKKATGDPPLKYLQQIRIQKAKEKLETTKDTVDEITWAVGYKDISSFGRLFKQYTQLSPRTYREKFALPDRY
ncbi:MAG: helix-turn-helix domain-containing protein [Desulfobacterales bacterium]|nr:helix-turn-helix domain-containing protein [Desulfobacterales bacterium]